MKKMLLIILTGLMLAGCGSDESSEEQTFSLSEQEISENFIQFDEEGKPYVESSDGSKEYIDIDLDDNEDTSDADEYTIETLTGDFEGPGYKLTISDGWYGEKISDTDIRIYESSNEARSDYIAITTYAGAGVSSFEEMSADNLTEDFNTAVDDGVYKAYEFIESYPVEVGGYEALYYKGKITFEDTDIISTTYIVNDDLGGHLILCNDTQNDGHDVGKGFNALINSIIFQ